MMGTLWVEITVDAEGIKPEEVRRFFRQATQELELIEAVETLDGPLLVKVGVDGYMVP